MRASRGLADFAAAMFLIASVGVHPAFAAGTPADVRAQILALEHRRCEAIATGNAQVLSELLADDYVHVHGTGKVDTKSGFISNIREHPRKTERGELTVRIYGDIAVVTGEQFNYMQPAAAGQTPNKTNNYVTQVLRRVSGRWQYVSFQLTPTIPM
jgi:hypothetical protein